MIKQYSASSFLMLLFVFIFLNACKKEKTPMTPDCETNNYGTVSFRFTDNAVRHEVIVTYPDNSFKEKFISIGTLQDTVHLKPGQYLLNIYSLDKSGQSIKSDTKTVVTQTCSEQTIQESF